MPLFIKIFIQVTSHYDRFSLENFERIVEEIFIKATESKQKKI
jgi:hypothetical protein